MLEYWCFMKCWYIICLDLSICLSHPNNSDYILFDSIVQCAKYFKVARPTIMGRTKMKKSWKGYEWFIVEDQDDFEVLKRFL